MADYLADWILARARRVDHTSPRRRLRAGVWKLGEYRLAVQNSGPCCRTFALAGILLLIAGSVGVAVTLLTLGDPLGPGDLSLHELTEPVRDRPTTSDRLDPERLPGLEVDVNSRHLLLLTHERDRKRVDSRVRFERYCGC
ncbi:MAG: hypothetical protein R3320_01170, partial [Nitriliruptorales bacterium]|nr:hypothetical protein [Nitriliruptorales bacterium]